MTRQAAYRLQQLAAGLCGRGCQRPRWGSKTMCRRCAIEMSEDQAARRAVRAGKRIQEAA